MFQSRKIRKKSAAEISRITDKNSKLKSRVWDLNLENSRLKVQVRDFDRVKEYLGIDKVREILKAANKLKGKKRSDVAR